MRSKEHLLEKGMKTKVLTSLPTRTLSQVVLKPVLLPTRGKKRKFHSNLSIIVKLLHHYYVSRVNTTLTTFMRYL